MTNPTPASTPGTRLKAILVRTSAVGFAAVWITVLWVLHALLTLMRPFVLWLLWVSTYVTLIFAVGAGFIAKYGTLYDRRWELLAVPLLLYLAIQVYEFVLGAAGHALRYSVDEVMGPPPQG